MVENQGTNIVAVGPDLSCVSLSSARPSNIWQFTVSQVLCSALDCGLWRMLTEHLCLHHTLLPLLGWWQNFFFFGLFIDFFSYMLVWGYPLYWQIRFGTLLRLHCKHFVEGFSSGNGWAFAYILILKCLRGRDSEIVTFSLSLAWMRGGLALPQSRRAWPRDLLWPVEC